MARPALRRPAAAPPRPQPRAVRRRTTICAKVCFAPRTSPPDGSRPIGGTVHRLAGVSTPVAIVGGTGALGFGLALRLGVAGMPVVIGSRDAGRAQEAATRAAARVPQGTFSGTGNEQAVAGAELVVLSVPFRSQSET